MKNIIYLLLMISFLFSCNKKEENKTIEIEIVEDKQEDKRGTNEKIAEYLEKNFANFIPNKDNCIIVLTDRGCHSCIEHFVDFTLKELINKDDVYIINCGSGSVFDIKPFAAEKKNKNTFDDTRNIFTNKILDKTSAIFMDKENNIDTIVEVFDANDVLPAIEYVKKRLSKKRK
ncbi:MAG: hypothetical protein LBM25_07905 [Bacteroidales bacterium]|nr:hypothetical protein [Bacteroidales bacterium]